MLKNTKEVLVEMVEGDEELGLYEVEGDEIKDLVANIETPEGTSDEWLEMMEEYNIGGLNSLRKYKRTLPKEIDVVKEYELIKLKQSKMCRWDRDEVVRLLEEDYKLA